MLKTAVLLHLGSFAAADVYFHNPRGSNNRLDDENRDRNNADRLFDSQNNNRGGVNVGQVYYYAGSTLPMEWSVQHSCGNPNNNCEMIIQIMCDTRLRDGTRTNTIPIRPNECYNWDCDTDVRFGRHESWDYYMNCKYRQRNKGLFTSSQNLQGDSAIYTRQNPNGARRGLECTEERDYYPYWAPTPWRDIAVLTNDCVRCNMYKAESENVKPRPYCSIPIVNFMRWYESGAPGRKLLPLTQAECQNITYYDKFTNKTQTGEWKIPENSNLPPPECICNPWARDNHHGNVEHGNWAGYNWKIPKWILNYGAAAEQCVVRLRYNISTGDFLGFANNNTVEPGVDYRNNKPPGGNENTPSRVDIGSFYGVGENNTRDYYLRNNPKPDAFGTPPIPLQLAINTAQYGRTFQDRTHKIAIRTLDATIDAEVSKEHNPAVLTNVNVRGKRGNIVQVYPSTEYDFVPNTLHCKDGVDYVHFQWTGSNTNPDNNAGQGRQGSDRHNVVALRAKNYEEPPVSQHLTDNIVTTYGHYGNSYPATLDSWSFLGFSRADMQNLAINSPNQFGGELSELDDSGTYFDLGVRKCGNGNSAGRYHYLCTRNNNFSNRSQQAKVEISSGSVGAVTLNNAAFSQQVGGSTIMTSPGGPTALASQSLMVTSTPSKSSAAFQQSDISSASDVTCLSNFNTQGGLVVTLKLSYETNPMKSFDFVRAETAQGPYESVDGATIEGGVATAQITQGGCYTVKSSPNAGVIIGIVLACIAVVGGVGFGLYWKFGRGAGKKGTQHI